MSFVHLRAHTEFSVVDGTLRIDDLVSSAAADGQGALAVTDLSNMFGAVKFYSGARKKGVKPILGADVWLEPEGSDKQPTRLLLLVQNRQGYLNLCEILSRAWLLNGPRGQAWVSWEWLAELGGDLIALSGADLGAVGQALLAGDRERAVAMAQRLSGYFPGRFYIELQRAALAQQEAHVRLAVPLAAELGLPVVATHPVQFLEPDDFEAHEARTCIAEGETLSNPKRIKRFGREQYFKTQAQMEALWADIPSAIANTLAIAQRCSLSLVLGKPQLPDFPTPLLADGTPMPMADYFRVASHEGLEVRLLALFPKEEQREKERPRYVERLEFELGCRLAGGLCAEDHRPRPAEIQPAVRAVFEPRTRLDARLRHRFLPGQPRPRHRLREGQVRPRCGEPDCHLRHHGRQGSAARHRPRVGHGLRPCGQRGQADPGATRQDRDPGQSAREA
jgi:DNA polymerase-3 subunit alpha